MELKPGYKQTEIGIIPEDWEVTTVGEEFSIQLGKMLDAEKNVGVPKPYLGNRAVQWGRVDLTGIGFMKMSPSDLQRFRLQQGDLLVCEGGEIGRAAIWQQPMEECYYQKALHRLRAKGGYSVELMLNVLHRLSVTGFLLNFVTQTSIAHLPKDKFETVPIPLPPTRAEQEAIAKALSDADALVESLEQLLAKKRHLKQGAMQELLTGKRRLPGSGGDWEVKRLGELAAIRSGGTPSTTQPAFWDGDILWCTPTDITALNGRKYLSDTNRKITRQGLQASSAEMIPAHSIVMTSRATIGECAINTDPVSTNQGFKNFIPSDQIDVEFLYYLLLTQKQRFIGLCGGSIFLEIGKAQLSQFEVRVPATKAEQTAVATVLSDMDAEIAALEAKLAKARQLKQGMMQELLTGRIRLV
jgi:type I restriction enzyme S subunit